MPELFGLQAPVLVALGTSLGYAALLIWVLRRRGACAQGWLVRTLWLYLLLSLVWSVGFGLTLWFGVSGDSQTLGLRLAYAMLMLLSLLAVVLTLLFLERPGVRWVLIAGGVWLTAVLAVEVNIFDVQAALLGAVVNLTVDSVVQVLQVAGWFGFSLGLFTLAGLDYFQTRRPLHRNRLLFWLLGLLLVLGGEALTLLERSQYLVDVTQIGLVVRFLGAIVVAVAAVNHQLPVLKTVARRALTAAFTTAIFGGLIFAGIWMVLTTSAQQVSFSTVVVAMIAAALLAIFQQPLRELLHRLIDRVTNRGHYNPARALRDYGDAISNILELETLVTVAVGIIAEALDVRRGALLLITERDERVDVQVLPGMGTLPRERSELAPDSPILAEWRQGLHPLTQYEIDVLPQYRSAPLKERTWLQSLDMEVYVPILARSVLIGVLAVGRRETAEPHSAQDLDVLMTVGNQTAVVLQNARLVNDLKTANRSITRLNDELSQTNSRLEKLDTAKTDFIEIASHELRTPLTQIRGYSDIMSDMMQQGNLVASHMTQISTGITRASVRLEGIIAAMLDVSRIDAQALDIRTAPLSIPAVIRMALDNFKDAIRDRQMKVEAGHLDGLPAVQGDLQRLCQAFSNIIGNAIKYTPDGGSITISGHLLNEPAAIDAALKDAVPFVEVLIADTGIGIDRNDQTLIFEKFYRVGAVELHSTGATKFKGAGPGLGLTIA
ncbi:MAG TPA: ATP-binding protein, partial [Anaerolineae bacterium]|nr:ATP-binding protein [Anaerolineae bacterium]